MPIEFGTWIGIRTVIFHIFIPIWPQVIRKVFALWIMDSEWTLENRPTTTTNGLKMLFLKPSEAENVLRFPRPQAAWNLFSWAPRADPLVEIEAPSQQIYWSGFLKKKLKTCGIVKATRSVAVTAEHQSPESNSLQRAVRLTDWHSQQQVGYRWWVSTSELIN